MPPRPPQSLQHSRAVVASTGGRRERKGCSELKKRGACSELAGCKCSLQLGPQLLHKLVLLGSSDVDSSARPVRVQPRVAKLTNPLQKARKQTNQTISRKLNKKHTPPPPEFVGDRSTDKQCVPWAGHFLCPQLLSLHNDVAHYK